NLVSNSVNGSSITNGSITAAKLATNQVVKSLTAVSSNGTAITFRDDVTLQAGINIELIAASNVVQITSTSNGIVGWATSGNVLNSNDFLGTLEAQTLELRVSNTPALRLEPTTNTANIVAGAAANRVISNAYGAAILGGGTATESNVVSGNLATTLGGSG